MTGVFSCPFAVAGCFSSAADHLCTSGFFSVCVGTRPVSLFLFLCVFFSSSGPHLVPHLVPGPGLGPVVSSHGGFVSDG